jgi:hypothetical protein
MDLKRLGMQGREARRGGEKRQRQSSPPSSGGESTAEGPEGAAFATIFHRRLSVFRATAQPLRQLRRHLPILKDGAE